MTFSAQNKIIENIGSLIHAKGILTGLTKDPTFLVNAKEAEPVAALLFFYLKDFLSEPYFGRLKRAYFNASAYALRQEAALYQLYKELEKSHIRFAPFKGVDLAYRIYPAGALRSFSDWDILFHPDDIQKALQLLKSLGWNIPYLTDLDLCQHHEPRYYKDNFQLEPHRTLPGFEGVNEVDLWNYITPRRPGSLEHILSPELNLLMLARHASISNYMHLPALKLLLDAAFLIQKENINWDKLRLMSKQWQLASPENLLGAWPEFFPAETIAQMHINPESARSYRKLFEEQKEYSQYSPQEWVMNQPDRWTQNWWKQRFRSFHPQCIRSKYQLAVKGSYLQLGAAYIKDIFLKATLGCRSLFHPNAAMTRRQKLINHAENPPQDSSRWLIKSSTSPHDCQTSVKFYMGKSMHTLFPQGAQIKVESGDFSHIHRGDVIVFESHGRLVVHRVIGKLNGKLQTMGDDNSIADIEPVTEKMIRGKVFYYEYKGKTFKVHGGSAGVVIFYIHRVIFLLKRCLKKFSAILKKLF